MKLKFPLILSLLLLFTIRLEAQIGVQINNFNSVDKLINQFISTWKINGGSVAIAKNGNLIYNKGFGYSDQHNSIPAIPNQLYRVASVSKPITSVAIMKLIEEGKLSLSDTVFGKNKILNQPYYLSVITDSRIYSITIQQLLEHSAGWDRNIPTDGYPHNDPAFFPLHVTSVLGESNPVGDSTLIKFSLLKGLNFSPGKKYAYSNVGYLVLGKVIEKISGMSYGRYVEQKILDPSAINDTHLGKNFYVDRHERESEYMSEWNTTSCYGDGVTVPWQYGGFNVEAMNAHGGWTSTAADLTRLLLTVDGNSKVPDILKAFTLETMGTADGPNPKYAKGWSVNSSGNWWHTGSMDGTSAFIGRTNDGYAWAFLFNSRSDNSNAFWKSLDRLPWKCMKEMSNIPDVNLFAPTLNLSNIKTKVSGSTSALVSWTKGSGDARIIIVSEDSILTHFPIDGTNYNAHSTYGRGAKLGSAFVVHNGKENRFNLRNLDPAKTYYLYGFEYYKNSNTAGNPVYKLADKGKAIIRTSSTRVQKTDTRLNP